MTIYELKRLNQANGGNFFSRRTMHFFGDTLKGFGLTKMRNGNILVFRKAPREGRWIFSPSTGRQIG